MDIEKIQLLQELATAFASAAGDLAEGFRLIFDGGGGAAAELRNEAGEMALAAGRFRRMIETELAETGQESHPEVKDLLEDALMVDGAHHKQWYLEQLYERLGWNTEELRQAAAPPLARGIAP